ncbi:hypothetical protein ACEWY4_006951 [Coilia grayii]|uniref:TNFR-Cys domain-containing protein n=1 Tax=Coilia grayii TaxID=363190 RepID=A0ABD1KF73_9TELE
MASSLLLFILYLTGCLCVSRGTGEICRGTHCFGAYDTQCTGAQCLGRTGTSSGHLAAATRGGPLQSRHQNGYNDPASRGQAVPYTIYPPQHARESYPRQNPRSITAEVYNPGCTDRDCATHKRPSRNDTQECKGIECKSPHRIRPKPKPQPCVGEQCSAAASSSGGRARSTVLHLPDRAAQFLGEFSDIASDLGSSPGIQLTCDVKGGSNEVPSEDALVLQLHLAKGQEQLVEELRVQQVQVSDLQGRLSEQQSSLLAQQRDMLEQQRRTQELLEQVKAQFSLLQHSLNQLALHNAQGEMGAHISATGGGQARPRVQESYAAHKVDMEASVMEVGQPLLGCVMCATDEYCDYSGERPHCEKCTVCPPGFFLVAQCSVHADRICQDRDECLEITHLCGEQNQCLNTPGGFRCQGMSEREGAAGHCGHGYFYSSHLQECQACSECDHIPMATPCSAVRDTICATAPEGDGHLSLSWAGDVVLPPSETAHGHAFPSMQLKIQAKADSCDNELLTCTDGQLGMRQHGLVWADYNLALRHGCRSFVQACLRLNTSRAAAAAVEGGQQSEGRDLSGVRVEQREGKTLQSASVSAASAVEAGEALALLLRSASHHCSAATGEHLHLHAGAAPPFSLLWLSHDTGAVAMTAQAVASAHYHTNYRPTFRTTSVSDPYVVTLTHDERAVRFTESGSLRFVLQQAVYSMGQTCVSEGFTLLAYITRNSTSMELARASRHGVHYRDTSISLSAAATVHPGDTLSFEILAPAQCNVRYFGDDSGISMLSLLWVPRASSTSLAASVSSKGLPSGAVRNRVLYFHQTSARAEQLEISGAQDAHPQRDLLFRRAGSASLALELKLIHSCSLLRLTLHRRVQGEGSAGAKSEPLAQQVAGQMPEGSQWANMALRASFQVRNGTAVFVMVDCVRGRINQIAHESGSSGMSVLWVAA